MDLTFETEQEDDGRWLAEVPEIAGVMAYGATQMEAIAKAEALAYRVLADRLQYDEVCSTNLTSPPISPISPPIPSDA